MFPTVILKSRLCFDRLISDSAPRGEAVIADLSDKIDRSMIVNGGGGGEGVSWLRREG